MINWVIDDSAPPAGQTLVTSGLNTSSPVIGTTDPSLPDNADASDFHSDFPEIVLANSGDAILLTGSVTLTGINSSQRNFRFGLFDRNGSPGTTGWLGYFAANSVATSYGEIRQRDAGNSGLHVSITGSTEIMRTTTFPSSSTGAPFTDHTYRFELRLTRDGSAFDIISRLYNTDGTAFADVLRVEDRVPAATESFRFNNVAFLLGGGLNTDQAAFSDIDVTYLPVPEPASWALFGIATFWFSTRRRGQL